MIYDEMKKIMIIYGWIEIKLDQLDLGSSVY